MIKKPSSSSNSTTLPEASKAPFAKQEEDISFSTEKMVCVGVVMGHHGLQGRLKVKPFTATVESFYDYETLYLARGTALPVRKISPLARGFVGVEIQGILSLEQAAVLEKEKLYVFHEDLPELPDDEFYYIDLIGMSVEDEAGEVLGVVKAVHNYGAGDIVEFNEQAPKMIIFNKKNILVADRHGRRLVVDKAAILDTNPRPKGKSLNTRTES